jgi:hypothetical protein
VDVEIAPLDPAADPDLDQAAGTSGRRTVSAIAEAAFVKMENGDGRW